MLYHLLTGHSTFNATDHYSTIHQITNHPHIPIETRRVDLPKELCRIVDHSLQKNIADRYPDWKEFLSDLYAASGIARDAGPAEEQTRFELTSHCIFFKDFLTVEIWEVLRASRGAPSLAMNSSSRKASTAFLFLSC